MSIENDILRPINFDEVISDFANAKARQVPGHLEILCDSDSVCVCNFQSSH